MSILIKFKGRKQFAFLFAIFIIQSSGASTTIQASSGPVSQEVTFSSDYTGIHQAPTKLYCARQDSGDPKKVTIDFYGEYPCDGQTHTFSNYGVTWPAHLTVRNYDGTPVTISATLTDSAGKSSHITPTIPGGGTCSATLETSISLGRLTSGEMKSSSLMSGVSSGIGIVTFEPSNIVGNQGGLTPGNDVLYNIPEATWDVNKNQWHATSDKNLTIAARVMPEAVPGTKNGYLTATISCP
jgi:hypothetical protein